MRLRAVLLLALAAAAAAAPLAAAQQAAPLFQPSLVLLLQPSDEPVTPLTGVSATRGEVEYRHATAGGLVGDSTRVHLRVAHAPPWATVTLSPSTLVLHRNMPGGTDAVARAAFHIVVTTTMDAPAFVPAEVRVLAEAEPSGLLEGATADASLLVSAAYVGLLDVRPPARAIGLPPGATVTLPVTVTNFGNGVTTVRATVLDAPDGVRVALPTPLTLESRQGGGRLTQGTLDLDVRADRGFRGGVLTLRVHGHYALDARLEGDAKEVQVRLDADRSSGLVEAQAASLAGAPGGGLPLVLGLAGAAGGAALARRRLASR